jgi:hypothetical protein
VIGKATSTVTVFLDSWSSFLWRRQRGGRRCRLVKPGGQGAGVLVVWLSLFPHLWNPVRLLWGLSKSEVNVNLKSLWLHNCISTLQQLLFGNICKRLETASHWDGLASLSANLCLWRLHWAVTTASPVTASQEEPIITTLCQPKIVCCCCFEIESCYAAQVSLKLTILLPQPPECWDYRCEPPTKIF